MKISAILHKSAYAKCAHPVFAVDGVPIDVWLDRETHEENVLNLVPAQGWLYNDDEFELSWRRLRSLEPDTCTFVPLLVCSDDMDLSCSVVIVEQCISADAVVWNRFGWDVSYRKEAGSTIRWFKTQAIASFEIAEFKAAVEEFKKLFDEEAKKSAPKA